MYTKFSVMWKGSSKPAACASSAQVASLAALADDEPAVYAWPAKADLARSRAAGSDAMERAVDFEPRE